MKKVTEEAEDSQSQMIGRTLAAYVEASKEKPATDMNSLLHKHPAAFILLIILAGPGGTFGVNYFRPGERDVVPEVTKAVRSVIKSDVDPKFEAISARIDGLNELFNERISSVRNLQEEKIGSQSSRLTELSQKVDRLTEDIATNRDNYRRLRDAFYNEHTEAGTHRREMNTVIPFDNNRATIAPFYHTGKEIAHE